MKNKNLNNLFSNMERNFWMSKKIQSVKLLMNTNRAIPLKGFSFCMLHPQNEPVLLQGI